MENLTPQNNFILYTSDTGDVKLEVFVQDETIWLTQKMMSELFDIEVSTVSYHIQEIYKSFELQEIPTIRKIRIVQKEGSRDVFNKTQKIDSDFEKEVKKMLSR